jgi:hypothetical protein
MGLRGPQPSELARTGAERQRAYAARVKRERSPTTNVMPKPTYITRSITVRDDHHAAIDAMAAAQNRGWSSVLRDVLAAGLAAMRNGGTA